jgi:hypothetical protein
VPAVSVQIAIQLCTIPPKLPAVLEEFPQVLSDFCPILGNLAPRSSPAEIMAQFKTVFIEFAKIIAEFRPAFV